MTGYMLLDPDELKDHAATVQRIAHDGVGGAAEAGGQELILMTHVLGLICTPFLAPGLEALGLAAEGMVAATEVTGVALASGVKVTAEASQAVEDEIVKALGGTPGVHGGGTAQGSSYGGAEGLVSAGEPKAFGDVPVLGSACTLVSDVNANKGGFDIGMDSFAYGLDVLVAAIDPVDFVFGAVVGFIIDLIPPVKWFVDALTGDPQAIEGCSTTWNNLGGRLDQCAADFNTSVSKTLGSWTDPASVSYAGVAGAYSTFLQASGSFSQLVGIAVTVAGLICSTLRGLFIEAMKYLVAELVIEIGTALAAAGITFGGSVGVAVAAAEIEVATLAADMAAKLSKTTTRLAQLGEACGHNASQLRTASSDLKQFSEIVETAADSAKGITGNVKAFKTVIDDLDKLHGFVDKAVQIGKPLVTTPEDPTAK